MPRATDRGGGSSAATIGRSANAAKTRACIHNPHEHHLEARVGPHTIRSHQVELARCQPSPGRLHGGCLQSTHAPSDCSVVGSRACADRCVALKYMCASRTPTTRGEPSDARSASRRQEEADRERLHFWAPANATAAGASVLRRCGGAALRERTGGASARQGRDDQLLERGIGRQVCHCREHRPPGQRRFAWGLRPQQPRRWR